MNPISSDIFGRLSWLTKTVKKLCCALNLIRPYKVYTALLTQSGGNDEQIINTGLLTVGVTYLINIEPGDSPGFDFTNVGAPNNNQGTYFVATGTTPNSWGSDEGGPDTLKYNSGAPVATVLENTIGNIWFTYGFTGQYIINSDNLFVIDKTINTLNQTSNISSSNDQQYFAYCLPNGESMLTTTLLDSTLTNTDDVLYNKLIEIRVYN